MNKETIIKILGYLFKVYEILKKGDKKQTGALEDNEDFRDVPAKAVISSKRIPKEYINPLVKKIESYNQKRLGVCVATAQTSQMELLYPDKDFSVKFAYRMAKYLDTYKGEGTYGRTMAKVHMKFGSATVKTRPEDFNQSHFEYVNFNFTDKEILEAKKYKIKGYVFAHSNNEIKALVKEHGSVSIRINAKAMWNNIIGFHRVLIVGWNEDGFLFKNSWGYETLDLLPYSVQKSDCIAYIKDTKTVQKIKKYVKKQEKKYKYFTSKEANGISEELMLKLDKIRHKLKKPIRITSGFRTQAHNKKIGGSSKSYHLKGMAVDIRMDSKQYAYDLIKLAFENDITGIEVGDNHIHLDIRPKENRLIFKGKSY